MKLCRLVSLRATWGSVLKLGGSEVKGLAHELQEFYSAWT